jgi:hypothetical protein
MVIRRNDDSRVRNHEIAETNQSCMCHWSTMSNIRWQFDS